MSLPFRVCSWAHLDAKINEILVIHGTTEGKTKQIANFGFDGRLASERGLCGPSCIFGLGDWTGRKLWVQDNRERNLLELQERIEGIGKRSDKLFGQKDSIKDGLTEFDGKRVHETMEFTGAR